MMDKNMQFAFSFDKQTVLNILRQAIIAALATFVYVVLESLTHINFGEYNPVIIPVIALLIHAVDQWRTGVVQ